MHVRQAVQILSDDDPDNDHLGFVSIAQVLLYTGDDQGVTGLLRTIFARREGNNVESDSDDEEYDSTPLECDGVCSRYFKHTDRFWICRYCFDVGFCDDCRKLVKKDRLPIDQCSSKHDWLLTQMDGKRVPAGKLYVGRGDEMVDLEDWKMQLKKTWKV